MKIWEFLIFYKARWNPQLKKGTFGRKKVKLKWKSVKNAEKRAITDLNAPNGSRDIPFQSQEFGQDGHRHFAGFQPHFWMNMMSQTQYCKTMTKWKCNHWKNINKSYYENILVFKNHNFSGTIIWLFCRKNQIMIFFNEIINRSWFSCRIIIRNSFFLHRE